MIDGQRHRRSPFGRLGIRPDAERGVTAWRIEQDAPSQINGLLWHFHRDGVTVVSEQDERRRYLRALCGWDRDVEPDSLWQVKATEGCRREWRSIHA